MFADFLIVTTRICAIGIWVGAGDAAELSTMHRTAPLAQGRTILPPISRVPRSRVTDRPVCGCERALSTCRCDHVSSGLVHVCCGSNCTGFWDHEDEFHTHPTLRGLSLERRMVSANRGEQRVGGAPPSCFMATPGVEPGDRDAIWWLPCRRRAGLCGPAWQGPHPGGGGEDRFPKGEDARCCLAKDEESGREGRGSLTYKRIEAPFSHKGSIEHLIWARHSSRQGQKSVLSWCL